MNRAAGILLHISSLPSKFGIGTLGQEAYAFADFLSRAHQKYWQILPVGPTGFGDSPYQNFSVFAGNPYFIDFEILRESGFLSKNDYENIDWGNNPNFVDYKKIYDNRFNVLKIAFKNFQKSNLHKNELQNFVENNEWVNNYALFMALKTHFKMAAFTSWPKEIKNKPHDILKKMWKFTKRRGSFLAVFTVRIF